MLQPNRSLQVTTGKISIASSQPNHILIWSLRILISHQHVSRVTQLMVNGDTDLFGHSETDYSETATGGDA
jgi:hypothetical protein